MAGALRRPEPGVVVEPSYSRLDCIVAVMQAAGATPDAIAFLQELGYFLSDFEELGAIDFGRGAAPWFNMGRLQQVLFLNGMPYAIEVTDTIRLHYERLRSPGMGSDKASYAEVMGTSQFPPGVWSTRARLASSELRNGAQVITLDVPFYMCSACDLLGYMPVEFLFSLTGILLQSTLLPFKAP